jgi:diguanylate cyclase (GGDEF)-like protein
VPPPEPIAVFEPAPSEPISHLTPPPPEADRIDLEDLMDEPPRPSRPSPLRRDSAPTPPAGMDLRNLPQRASVPPEIAASEFVSIRSRSNPPPTDPPLLTLDQCLSRIGVALVETDETGRIVRLNDTAEHLLHVSPESGPTNIDDLLHTGVVSTTSDGPLAEGADTTGWIVRDDGEPLGVRHVIAPRDGAPGSIIVFRESQTGAVFAPAIARRARYDPLTGLYSRRGIMERIDQALAESRASGASHALCYIDLDRFRLVNSTCGHDAGDDLLQWVATRLYEVLPAGAAAARIAADEFAILITEQEQREAERIARDIQRHISEFRFAWGHKTFLIDSSLGLFAFGAECESGAAALDAASHACRIAKKNGGARLQIFLENDEDMAQSRRSMEWIAGIQHHLAEGKLQLYAQTIHPIGGRKEQGGHFEILMRVIDENGRPTSPVGIIEAAENGRVMDSIDRFVLRKAFQTIGALSRRALRKLDLVSVNLSAISLAREGLLDFIVEHMSRSAVPPGKVCFEITETAALNNLDEVRWLIQELGAMGCRFAIDDFGSGHASYGYIERLPVDYVKIDGMFVRDMMTNALHRAIVESVNRIATTLGIKTIAECVETAAAADVLAGMGVHYGQGWYYAKPAPIGEVCKALDVE